MKNSLIKQFKQDIEKQGFQIEESEIVVTKYDNYYLVETNLGNKCNIFDKTRGIRQAVYNLFGKNLIGIDLQQTIWDIDGKNFYTICYDDNTAQHLTHFAVNYGKLITGINFDFVGFAYAHEKGYILNNRTIIIEIYNYKYLYDLKTLSITSFPFSSIVATTPVNTKTLKVTTEIFTKDRANLIHLIGYIDLDGNFLSPLIVEETEEEYSTIYMNLNKYLELIDSLKQKVEKKLSIKTLTFEGKLYEKN